MKRTAHDALRNPVLVGVIAAVLTLLLTAGARMSSGVWLFLGVAVFLGAQKAHEGILKGRR